MKSLFLITSLIITNAVGAMMPPPPPPVHIPAVNPAAVHTMHHSGAVTAPAPLPAQVPVAPVSIDNSIHHPSAQNNPARSDSKANQYYENSVIGLREYLDSIEHIYPQVHKELDQKVLKLEQQHFNAKLVGIGSIVTSAVLTVGAFTFLQAEETYQEGNVEQVGFTPQGLPNYEVVYTDKKRDVANFAAIAVGGLVFTGGAITSMLMRPDQNDIRRVINQHNRLLPDDPLSIGFNFNPVENSTNLN